MNGLLQGKDIPVQIKTYSESVTHNGIAHQNDKGIELIYYQNQQQGSIRRVFISQEQLKLPDNQIHFSKIGGQTHINYRFMRPTTLDLINNQSTTKKEKTIIFRLENSYRKNNYNI